MRSIEKKMTDNLIKEIFYEIKIGGEYELDFLLDPTKSALMYKHIKNKLPDLPKKYAIKTVETYFSRLFDSLEDAYDFGRIMNEDNLIDGREKAFLHLTRFELFTVEEI